jgi:hypothetical protein
MALEAVERHDFEAFHDLAWRAVRKGPPKDTDLMQMLARAQSLSGRPLDALVMLQRLLELGVTTDAATSDDFSRVRALPGWADFEARAAATAGARPPAVPAPEPAPEPAGPIPAAEPRRPDSADAPVKAAAAPTAATPATAALDGDAADALRFTTLSFTPAGLAYDRVSDRFIVGDYDARKLTVVDEASQRVANLAGAQSAGFGSIAALEIDAREGDLWVVSSPTADAVAPSADGAPPAAILHKLQLISGRVLYAVPLEPGFGEARFTDIALTPGSSALVLDAAGRRVFVAQPRSRRLALALQLKVEEPSSLAPESDRVVYVAHRDGVLRADLGARRVRPLSGSASINLAGFTRIRWHRRTLIGVQAAEDGTHQIVRLRLNPSGLRVTGVDVLDRSLRMRDPTAAALSGDSFFYLAATRAGEPGMQAETIIRRVTVH